MEGLGCQGRAAEGPGGEAGLEEEELLELRSRGQSIDSACDSHLPSHPLPPYSTSAPLPGGALAPEEGRNTAPRRGKRGGVGLLGPGGRVPHGRGSEDRSEEVLPEPGGRVPHRKWSEDSGLDVPQRSEEVLLEPGGREIHRLRCEDSGPGDHDDTWSERIDLESGQGRTSVQLRNKEWTGPETREEKQKWASAPETEQQSPLLTSGPEASRGASPGTRRCMRTLLPPTEISSSPWCIVPSTVLLLVSIVLAVLLGRSSPQVVPKSPCSQACPMDWLYSRNKCYYLSMIYKGKGDWDESQRFCSSHNGSLALFDTQEDLNFLMHICSTNHMWVGLRNIYNGIHWANGTACSSGLCTVPDSGECAYIQEDALWVSGCHLKRQYICTKEPYL